MRGSLIDVSRRIGRPFRIEVDDDVVVSIRRFDPDDQRTLADAKEVAIHPVREAVLGGDELTLAKERLSELCDSLNMPSSKRRQLLEELGTGRSLLGIEGYLPAFYDGLETVFDYLPEPTQVVALERALATNPVRLLFADEVGLGKTIEAGLVISELKARGRVRRTLIVAPKGVQLQWVAEMSQHFGEEFVLVGAGGVPVDVGINPWTTFDQVVCSLDSIKPLRVRQGPRLRRHPLAGTSPGTLRVRAARQCAARHGARWRL